MARYHWKQQVDWRTVMAALRWYLLLRKEQCARILKSSDIAGESACHAREQLRADLEMYRNLRKFLGYSRPASVEQEISALLGEEAEEK